MLRKGDKSPKSFLLIDCLIFIRTISDPPSVSISSCGPEIHSGNRCTVSCNITPGNPSWSRTMWTFVQKFSIISQDLPQTEEHLTFTANNDSAGTYSCQATNGLASSTTAETNLTVICKLNFISCFIISKCILCLFRFSNRDWWIRCHLRTSRYFC